MNSGCQILVMDMIALQEIKIKLGVTVIKII
jgi:hypothetical protein